MLETLIIAVLVAVSATYSIWRLLPHELRANLLRSLQRRAPGLARRLAGPEPRRRPLAGNCNDCAQTRRGRPESKV